MDKSTPTNKALGETYAYYERKDEAGSGCRQRFAADHKPVYVRLWHLGDTWTTPGRYLSIGARVTIGGAPPTKNPSMSGGDTWTTPGQHLDNNSTDETSYRERCAADQESVDVRLRRQLLAVARVDGA